MEVPIYDFPISAYSQNANEYVSPNDKNYNIRLLSSEYQNFQLAQFYNHYYSTNAQGLSPWSEQMIRATLRLIKENEAETLENFNNQNKSSANKHYAANFKEHDQTWWNNIKKNMNLDKLDLNKFHKNNRAISITNTYARALPDAAPDFFHPSLPGQGFPFDNLQESAIWAGTPLYVFHVSKNKAWSLVLTPDGYFAWVHSDDIAYVSNKFIYQWQKAARQNLIAITQTETNIVDKRQQFKFTAYIGSVFPMIKRDKKQTSIFIPFKGHYNQASIKTGIINSNASSTMPLIASPNNLVKIINQLKNRPYGWGGAFFFNDCSQEIKSIFTPFGIWLPRNSSQQAQLTQSLDLSKNNTEERISFLQTKGHLLMTIIYIGHHVMLYVGDKDLGNDKIAITYQNVWGIPPQNPNKRYVIGQSLFFPLLKIYPENTAVCSFASKSNFKLIYLDKLDLKADSPQNFVNRFMTKRDSGE